MYIDKKQLVNKIQEAAKLYDRYLAGRTFLFVFDKKKIEVIFKVDSFMHLTGVSSKLFPYSFRVEEIHNEKFNELYEVEYIFSKSTNENQYAKITYGDESKIDNITEFLTSIGKIQNLPPPTN